MSITLIKGTGEQTMKRLILSIVLILGACNTPKESPRHIKLQSAMDSTIQLFMESGSRGSGGYIGNGQILTAYHVIESHIIQQDRIFYAHNQVLHECTLIKHSKDLDLAILKMVQPVNLPVLKISLTAPKVGYQIYTIGFHFGIPALKVASHGHITNITGKPINLMFFDAAINRGASGGPVLNKDFEIIGVNQMIYTSTGDWAGIGICNEYSEFMRFINHD